MNAHPNHAHPPIPISRAGLRLVLLRDIIPAGVGRVILAVGRQASADADTAAIKLAHDPAARQVKSAFLCVAGVKAYPCNINRLV